MKNYSAIAVVVALGLLAGVCSLSAASSKDAIIKEIRKFTDDKILRISSNLYLRKFTTDTLMELKALSTKITTFIAKDNKVRTADAAALLALYRQLLIDLMTLYLKSVNNLKLKKITPQRDMSLMPTEFLKSIPTATKTLTDYILKLNPKAISNARSIVDKARMDVENSSCLMSDCKFKFEVLRVLAESMGMLLDQLERDFELLETQYAEAALSLRYLV